MQMNKEEFHKKITSVKNKVMSAVGSIMADKRKKTIAALSGLLAVFIICITTALAGGIYRHETPLDMVGVGSSPPSSSGSESAPTDSSMSIPSDVGLAAAVDESYVPLSQYVSGIRDVMVYEGMHPNVMIGVTWSGDEVSGVEADESGVDWNKPGKYTVKYTVTSVDGRQETETAVITVKQDLEQYMYGAEGPLKVLVGNDVNTMNGIMFDPPITEIVPDTENVDTSAVGEYLMTYTLKGEGGVEQTVSRIVCVVKDIELNVSNVGGSDDTGSIDIGSTVTNLGLWRLTAYMDTPEDQGPYVGQTASGAPLVAGRTVAVSESTCRKYGLEFGDKLMIDGHVYILEDYGGSAMDGQEWVDIFVDNPVDEFSENFNKYTTVYLVR